MLDVCAGDGRRGIVLELVAPFDLDLVNVDVFAPFCCLVCHSLPLPPPPALRHPAGLQGCGNYALHTGLSLFAQRRASSQTPCRGHSNSTSLLLWRWRCCRRSSFSGPLLAHAAQSVLCVLLLSVRCRSGRVKRNIKRLSRYAWRRPEAETRGEAPRADRHPGCIEISGGGVVRLAVNWPRLPPHSLLGALHADAVQVLATLPVLLARPPGLRCLCPATEPGARFWRLWRFWRL